MAMNFGEVESDASFDVTSDVFCPVFVPQSIAYHGTCPSAVTAVGRREQEH